MEWNNIRFTFSRWRTSETSSVFCTLWGRSIAPLLPVIEVHPSVHRLSHHGYRGVMIWIAPSQFIVSIFMELECDPCSCCREIHVFPPPPWALRIMTPDRFLFKISGSMNLLRLIELLWRGSAHWKASTYTEITLTNTHASNGIRSQCFNSHRHYTPQTARPH